MAAKCPKRDISCLYKFLTRSLVAVASFLLVQSEGSVYATFFQFKCAFELLICLMCWEGQISAFVRFPLLGVLGFSKHAGTLQFKYNASLGC